MGNFALKREHLSEKNFQLFITVYSKYQISFIFNGYLPKIYHPGNEWDLVLYRYLQDNINLSPQKPFKNLFIRTMLIVEFFWNKDQRCFSLRQLYVMGKQKSRFFGGKDIEKCYKIEKIK